MAQQEFAQAVPGAETIDEDILADAHKVPRGFLAGGGTSAPMPRYVRILSWLQLLIAVYLISNGIGVPAPAGIGPYAASLTALLSSTGIAYIIALSVAFSDAPKASG